MKNQVTVTANAEGLVIIPSKNNQEFGAVRVESTSINMEGGFVKKEVRSALLRGKTELLTKIYSKGQVLPGKIIVKETTTQAFEGQEPKRKGKEGEVITHGGLPVYREGFFTADLDAKDELLSMDHISVKNVVAAPAKTSEIPA